MIAEPFLKTARLLPEAMLLIDGSGKIVAANPAAIDLAGTPALEGSQLQDFISDPPATLARYLTTWGRSSSMTAGDLNWKRSDGSDEELRCEGALYRSQSESSTALILVRCTCKEAGQKRFSSLAETIDSQAREIEERRKTEAELAEAARRKDEFLAMLGHELRNPLAALTNALRVKQLCPAGDPAVCSADAIVARQVDLLARLVDDLLDVSRTTRGKIELRKQTVALEPIVLTAIDSIRAAVEAREHTLDVLLSADPIAVLGDRQRLEQVVSHLLANAAKFMDRKGHMSISLGCEGTQAVVRVKDDGCGIPAHLLDRVFDLFVQADRSLDRSQGGLGIGLTLVRNLVELHHGSVEAHSAGPGRGSEFVVRLPIVEQSQDLLTPAAGRPPAQAIKHRVLLVEDHIDIANMMGALVERLGHEVRIVHNGPAALAAATEYQPDVVLLDIGLPGMDGYEIARQLRNTGHDRALFVALTGYGQDEDRRRSKEAGFDHHFVKPVRLSALSELLGSLVS